MNDAGKIELLQLVPLIPSCQAELEKTYAVHDLHAAADPDALIAEVAPRVRAVVTDGHAGCPAAVLDRLPGVELIASNGVGYDNIDVPRCRARGMRVSNTPGVLDDAVAEMAVGLMLALARRIPQADAYVRAGRWGDEGNYALTGQLTGGTVGILGLGRIGKEIARRCEAMKMSVRYHGRNRQEDVPWIYHRSPFNLAGACDFLVAVMPATDETRGIVSREVLRALGPKGGFVNVGRGALHDEAALVELLQNGELGGAALDVFENEPAVPEALLSMDNVVLSPHQGSATRHTRWAMSDLVLRNLAAHFAGDPLLTEVVE